MSDSSSPLAQIELAFVLRLACICCSAAGVLSAVNHAGNACAARGPESRSVEALGTKIIADADVSFGANPNIPTLFSPDSVEVEKERVAAAAG